MRILVDTMYYVYMTEEEPRVEYETFEFNWDSQTGTLVCPNGQRVNNMFDMEKMFNRIKGHFAGTSYYIKDMKQGYE